MRYRFTDPRTWTVFSESAGCLDTLRRAGWPNVILSNHVPELEKLVGELGLSSSIHAVLSSAVVGWEKPHPQFFRYAVEQMGLPTRTWMVGDNPVADVAGARAAGIPALLVAPTAAAGPHLRDAVDAILR